MASSAWPDLWDIALAESKPADARATLLRMHAELFVTAPARDREAVASFEAIALGFVPLVNQEILADIARLVAPCRDTPPAVLDALAQRFPETREIVLALAPRLPPSVVDLLLGSPRDRTALAARHDIDEPTLERLLVLHDDAVDAALAANLAILPGDQAFTQLVERARHRTCLARVLLSRGDLPASDQAALYLAADEAGRERIRSGVAASALFQRPHLPFRIDAARVDALLAASRRGDVSAFESCLRESFGLPSDTEWRLLQAGRHELLALALRALGVEEDEAIRVFLTLHPAVSHSASTVFRLVRVIRTVARPTALALVEAILGARTSLAAEARHQPAMDPTGTRSQASASSAERAPREDLRKRTGS
jgi:hypothetical protein